MTPNIFLKTEREKRGWSQAEVASLIKAGKASYHRWESLGAMPSPFYRRALSCLFGKTIEELGLLPSKKSPSSDILSPEADLDGEQIRNALNTTLFLQLCSIMNESVHECRCEKYAIIIEEFERMNMQNELAVAMTRRQAVTSLALLPFSPPLCLAEESIHTLSASKHDLFLQEVGASLVACEDLASSSDPWERALVFRGVSRYLAELKEIIKSSSQYRERAKELACHCAILKTNVGWECVGDAATHHFAKEAVEITRDFGHVELYLSALSKLAWSYLYLGEDALALSTAQEAIALLKGHKGPVSVCISGGTWSTFSVAQARNFLDPDLAIKKAGEQEIGNTTLYGMKFADPHALIERGIAQAGYGQTGEAMKAYAQVVDPKSLEIVPPFRGILPIGWRLGTILHMAEASLTGNARDMGEAIRYLEYVLKVENKSKHTESKISALLREMRLAFPGEKQVSKLSEQMREKSQ